MTQPDDELLYSLKPVRDGRWSLETITARGRQSLGLFDTQASALLWAARNDARLAGGVDAPSLGSDG